MRVQHAKNKFAKFETCQASMIMLAQVSPAHQEQMSAQHQWGY